MFQSLVPSFHCSVKSCVFLQTVHFTMSCREKHNFGKLCPKGLDTLEIRCFVALWVRGAGGKVRDHVGQGYGKISQCLCTCVFYNAETPCPRASCEVRVFECELSTYLVCRGLTSPGLREELCHSPNITSQVHNQSPIVISPTGPVERELFLGANVGFHALATHNTVLDISSHSVT